MYYRILTIYLMFGREPNLPIHVIFGLTKPNDEERCLTKYIEKMKLCLQEAFKQAQTAANMSQN